MRNRSSSRCGRRARHDGHVRRPVADRDAGPDRDRAARRARGQGRPAAARRRLHRRGMRREVPRRRRARDGGAVRCSPSRAAADFNVWGLCPPAAESGVSRPSTGMHRASPAGATYDAFGSERYVLTFENRALRELASQAPYESLAILANNDTYGGGGIFGLYSTPAVDSSWADYLFVHEFGHHFAALADEYYTSPVAYARAARRSSNRGSRTSPRCSTGTSSSGVHLVAPSTPCRRRGRRQAFEALPARRAGAPQADPRRPPARERDGRALPRGTGARHAAARRERHRSGRRRLPGRNYDAQAFYRPQLDCIMFTRDQVPFCRVCESALERVIDSIAAGHGPP